MAGDPIKQAEEMLAVGVGMNEADMREVSSFLLELRNGSESREVHDIPPSVPENETLPDSDPPAPHPPPARHTSLDPLQAASPATRGGRQLLLDAALEAIRLADESSSRHNRVLQARNYHTATVYLEVLMSFNALSAVRTWQNSDSTLSNLSIVGRLDEREKSAKQA